MRLRNGILLLWLIGVACGDDDAPSRTDAGDAGSSKDAAASGAGSSTGTGGRASGMSGRRAAGTGGGGGSVANAGKGGQGGADAGAGGRAEAGSSSAGAGAGSQAPACLPAGSYCTWSNAEDCCSGSCDGDSCCGFLGDACMNGFGCCAGDCIGGYCQCPPGTLDCGNGCVDIEWNENRCGDCNTQCGVNSLCEQGECVCDPNLFDAQFYVQCADGCFNTRQDDQHCGDCTRVCTGGTECSGGTCECPFGTLDCGSGCEDITANRLRCGACNNTCDAASEDCVNRQCQCKPGLVACTPGVCTDRQTDESNCGTCGLSCTGNKTCQGGHCVN